MGNKTRSSIPQRIHLLGIGGDGMSAIADYLCDMNCIVSGSDVQPSPLLRKLAARGVHIEPRHHENHVRQADLIVVSDAIPPDNVEIYEARLRDIPILRRAAFVGRLASQKTSIFVAGAHGKTTTSAMIATALNHAGLNPSFIIGAEISALNHRRAAYSAGAYFVGEACEAFNNLAPLQPDCAIITNIDDEHLEHYGSQEKLDLAFRLFAEAARDNVIVNGDDPAIARALANSGLVPIRFGFGASNDISIKHYEPAPHGGFIQLQTLDGTEHSIQLAVHGRHNALNAAACAATCLKLGLTWGVIAEGLASFTGAARRWEDLGEQAGIRVIDDYAHHPAEIAASIETARALMQPGQRLVMAFQPLLASRTARLHQRFAKHLNHADKVLLLDTDCGGERASDNADLIANNLIPLGAAMTRLGDVEDFISAAPSLLQTGDFLIIAGAGAIRSAAPRIVSALANLKKRSAENKKGGGFSAHAESTVGALAAHVRSAPGNTAIWDGENAVSYAELDHWSDCAARALAHRNLTGSAIGVALASSVELAIAIVAIAKAGATYVPLDPTLPVERALFMCGQAEVKALVLSEDLSPAHSWRGAPHIFIEKLRREGENLANPLPREAAERAYICFTSGSTGRPKGVPIKSAALFALIGDIVPMFGVNSDTRTALNTAIGFDVAQAEFWMTLCGGGALCPTQSLRPLVGDKLSRFLRRARITHLAATPSVLRSASPSGLTDLHCVIAAGEACTPELVSSWGQGRQFFNAYGPTEATIYATVARCLPGEEVRIGAPLHHVEAFALKSDAILAEPGESGELCLGGLGVTDGYLDPIHDQESFVRFLHHDGRERRLYRTGDVVKCDPSGEFYFLGRRDNQIKIRGTRIELEEIEHVLADAPGASDAVCCLYGEGEQRDLVAFVQTQRGVALTEAAVRTYAEQWLIGAMMPTRILIVDELAHTASGKKDRQALERGLRNRTFSPRRQPKDFAPLRTPIEKELANLWRSILHFEGGISAFDEFSELGGDSLKALMLIAAVEERFGVVVPPGYFERITTIAAMAVQMNDLLWIGIESNETSPKGFYATRLYQQQRHLIAPWGGEKISDNSLIRSAGGALARTHVFLCVQYEHEWKAATQALGADVRVHAMRSGHLIMTYTPENIAALADHYLQELSEIAPTGRVVLAGICQGGAIAHAMAQKLTAAGRAPEFLVFIEQARLSAYDGPVRFYYAQKSPLNPHRRFETGLARYNDIYRDQYTLELLPGDHGGFHTQQQITIFAQSLRRRLAI